MKKVMVFVMMSILTFSLYACATTDTSVNAKKVYVTIDINPSIGFVVNELDEVISVQPLNADGEVLLVNIDVNGMKVDEALEILLDESINLGFIDIEAEETVVEIDVIGEEIDNIAPIEDNVTETNKDIEFIDKMSEQIESRIKGILDERDISNRVKKKEYRQEEINKARDLNLPPGHYRIMHEILLLNPELTIDDIQNLPINELIATFRQKLGIDQGIAHKIRDEFLEEKENIRITYQALIEQLEAKIKELSEKGQPIEELETQLNQLIKEMEKQHKELVEKFTSQSKKAREQAREEHRTRVEQHKERIQEFRNRNKGKK